MKQPPLKIGLAQIILAAFCLALSYYFRPLLSTVLPLSTDLPGHVALIERLREQLLHGRLLFYDTAWFGGWPAYQFYGFIPHLLAALLSFALENFSADPVMLSVSTIIWIGLALFPASLWFASRPLLRQLNPFGYEADTTSKTLLSAQVCFLSIWFLNLNYPSVGFGWRAIVDAGLFSQIIAWHLLLVFTGTALRALQSLGDGRNKARYARKLALIFAFLILTHPLSAIFAAFLTAVLWFSESSTRRVFEGATVLALLLCSFWIIPLLCTSSDYTWTHIHQPGGDILSALFSYSILEIPEVIRTFPKFDLTPLLILLFSLSSLALRSYLQSRSISTLRISFLLGALLFSSHWLAEGIPLGVHYYRFLPLLTLLFCIYLAPILAALYAASSSSAARSGLLTLAIVGILTSFTWNPSPAAGNGISSEARALLEKLKSNKPAGRVAFSSLQGSSFENRISPHLLPALVSRETGLSIETPNGLFIQSSQPCLLFGSIMQSLGLQVYTLPIMEEHPLELLPSRSLELLTSLGVSTLITNQEEGLKLAALDPRIELTTNGPFSIAALSGHTKKSMIEAVTKPVIGFLDNGRGSSTRIPFKYLDYYFASDPELSGKVELLAVDTSGAASRYVDHWLINDPDVVSYDRARNESYISFHAAESNPFSNSLDVEGERYGSISMYLSRNLDKNRLLTTAARQPTTQIPSIAFNSTAQEMTLSNLEPGKLYRINYAHFPYWSTRDGRLFRGSLDRILFVSNGEEASIRFSRIAHFHGWLGALLTGLGAIVFLVLKPRKSN